MRKKVHPNLVPFRGPQLATEPLYLVFDVRDCYEDKDAAVAAAKQLDGAQEGYIFCLELQSSEILT